MARRINCCGGGGAGVAGADAETQVLCDINGAISTPFIRFYETDVDTNSVTVIANLNFNGTTYTPTGVVGLCSSDDFEVTSELLCDNNAGVFTTFIRYTYVDETGTISQQVDLDLDGAIYVPTGTVGLCEATQPNVQILCDDTLNDGSTIVDFARISTFNSDGSLSNSTDVELDMTTPYAVVGTVSDCSAQRNPVAFHANLTGVQTFVFPDNLVSISYFVAQIANVANPPQVVIDGTAKPTYAGEQGSYSTEKGVLGSAFSIVIGEATDIVIISYMTR